MVLVTRYFHIRSLLLLTLFLTSSFLILGDVNVKAQSQDLAFRLYALDEPTSMFQAQLNSSQLGRLGWINGPPSRDLVPALGTLNKTETTPGKFDDIGTIFLYLDGDFGDAPKGKAGWFFDILLYAPSGWLYTLEFKTTSSGLIQGTLPLLLKSYEDNRVPLGIWKIGAQTTEPEHTTLFNASFTVGKYVAEISATGLPADLNPILTIDGTALGQLEASTKTIVGLGWLPEHSLSLPQDISNSQGTRYHAVTTQLKLSSGGNYDFAYKTQYYLTIGSRYPINGSGWYDSGVTVPITALAEIRLANGTRALFQDWHGTYSGSEPQISVVMDGPQDIAADYRTQHYLKVISELGNPSGEGWYDEGLQAEFSVSPSDGFPVNHVFTGWVGDFQGKMPTGSIIMSGPATVTATWRSDYTQLLLVVTGIVVAVSVSVMLVIRRRKTNSALQ